MDIDKIAAKKFEVSESTVRRWKSGVACPLPRVRELVIRELKIALEEK